MFYPKFVGRVLDNGVEPSDNANPSKIELTRLAKRLSLVNPETYDIHKNLNSSACGFGFMNMYCAAHIPYTDQIIHSRRQSRRIHERHAE